MSEPAVDYYHPPEMPHRASYGPSDVVSEIDRYLSFGQGDLVTRTLLAKALGALTELEWLQTRLLERIGLILDVMQRQVDDGK